MPTILACTDGAAYSSSIYQHAAWVATRLSARVEVLHVLDRHGDAASHADLSGPIAPNELVKVEKAEERVARLKGKAILDDARLQLAAAGVADIVETQRHGTLWETLGRLEPRCDLVVIGARGEHAEVAKAQLGSNLQKVIRAAIRPLLVVKRAYRPIRSFLIAYDGGPSIINGLEFVLGSPLLKGAACHMLLAGHLNDKAGLSLDEAASKLRDGGYVVTSHAMSGAPEPVIRDALLRENIDLLVMGAHGHSPIREVIWGSTTMTVARTSPVAVLMFR